MASDCSSSFAFLPFETLRFIDLLLLHAPAFFGDAMVEDGRAWCLDIPPTVLKFSARVFGTSWIFWIPVWKGWFCMDCMYVWWRIYGERWKERRDEGT